MTISESEVNELVETGELPRPFDPAVDLPTSTEMESYIDCRGKRCYRPRGEGERIRHENRVRRLAAIQREAALIRREVTEDKLDELDPDWRERFRDDDGPDYKLAEQHYLDQLRPRRASPVIHSSNVEPPTYGNPEPEGDVDGDDYRE